MTHDDTLDDATQTPPPDDGGARHPTPDPLDTPALPHLPTDPYLRRGRRKPPRQRMAEGHPLFPVGAWVMVHDAPAPDHGPYQITEWDTVTASEGGTEFIFQVAPGARWYGRGDIRPATPKERPAAPLLPIGLGAAGPMERACQAWVSRTQRLVEELDARVVAAAATMNAAIAAAAAAPRPTTTWFTVERWRLLNAQDDAITAWGVWVRRAEMVVRARLGVQAILLTYGATRAGATRSPWSAAHMTRVQADAEAALRQANAILLAVYGMMGNAATEDEALAAAWRDAQVDALRRAVYGPSADDADGDDANTEKVSE